MKRHQSGNAIVEFAIVLPVLLIVTLGIIGFGRFAYFGMVVSNAARAGAQYGAQTSPQGTASGDTNGMIAAAEADAANNGVGSVTSPAPVATSFCMNWDYSSPLPSPNPTSNPTCTLPSPGVTKQLIQYVQVTVTGTAKSGFTVPFLPSQVTISSTATQRVSQ